MNELVNIVEKMSSLEIAERTGKEHKHVLRDIRTMIDQLGSPNLDSKQYQVVIGNNNTTYEILLDKELTLVLATGYNVPLRLKIIKRWQELEQAQPQPTLPTTYIAALEALVISEKEKESIAALLELQAPKVEIANMLIADAKLLSISEALAHYSINRSAGFNMLKMCKWIYKKEQYDRVKTSIWLPTELARKNNWLILKQRCDEKGYTRPQTLVTGVGLTEMRKIFY